MRRIFIVAVLGLGLALSGLGCRGSSIAACGDEPDVSGAWRISAGPAQADAGMVQSITDGFEIEAALEQAGATDFLGLGRFVYGRLTASDPRYFTTLEIPRLLMNDGSKSGAILGCELRINVPIASPVTDDNVPQDPLRIALVGRVIGPGELLGIVGSRVIPVEDPMQQAYDFGWRGTRR